MTYRSISEWQKKKEKDAIRKLDAIIEKINKKELIVVNAGWWSEDGHFIFRMDFVESIDSKVTLR